MAFTKFTNRILTLLGTSKIVFPDGTELNSVTDMAAGSVSQNTVAKADSNGALVDSKITDDGTTVTADADVEVTGDAEVNGALTVDGDPVASGVQVSHIADIGNSATGTQIATAVNAILDALEAFGIAAAS
jgi:hypothetical protein